MYIADVFIKGWIQLGVGEKVRKVIAWGHVALRRLYDFQQRLIACCIYALDISRASMRYTLGATGHDDVDQSTKLNFARFDNLVQINLRSKDMTGFSCRLVTLDVLYIIRFRKKSYDAPLSIIYNLIVRVSACKCISAAKDLRLFIFNGLLTLESQTKP